VNFYVK